MNPTMLIIFGLLIVGLIAMSAFQNKQRKKQANQEQEKRNRICAGTTVITIGGIMGTVVSVDLDEKSFVLETNGTLIKFDMRAIYQMQLPAEVEAKIAAEAAALVAAQEAAKAQKKAQKKAKSAPAPEKKEEIAEEKAEEKAE
ncbi:MAG: preprotein translocase subunit YajC [Clostridia bacterium]|nr:preprotein translocase subunit YajC [Clostridia bacterium]